MDNLVKLNEREVKLANILWPGIGGGDFTPEGYALLKKYEKKVLEWCKESEHVKKSQEILHDSETSKENGDSLTCDDLERKAVGVGLRFRDELICDGVSREAAEIYAAIAQQKFMDGAKWQKEKLIEKACKFIRTPCIYVVDFNNYGGATTNYEATVEKFRKYMEE